MDRPSLEGTNNPDFSITALSLETNWTLWLPLQQRTPSPTAWNCWGFICNHQQGLDGLGCGAAAFGLAGLPCPGQEGDLTASCLCHVQKRPRVTAQTSQALWTARSRSAPVCRFHLTLLSSAATPGPQISPYSVSLGPSATSMAGHEGSKLQFSKIVTLLLLWNSNNPHTSHRTSSSLSLHWKIGYGEEKPYCDCRNSLGKSKEAKGFIRQIPSCYPFS